MMSRLDLYLSEIDEVIDRKYQRPGFFALVTQFFWKVSGRKGFGKPLSVHRA